MTISRIASLALAGLLVVLASWLPATSGAQSIARRVANAPDGKVRLTFAAHPDVCGHGTYISQGRNSRMTWSGERSDDVEYAENCDDSPVRLVMDVRGGDISRLRTYVGGRWRAPSGTVTDLGAVSTRQATDFLLDLVRTDNGKIGREAIFPATLADSVVIWPPLFRIARDQGRPSETRKQAVFWLGQAAGETITANLAALVNEDDVEREIRKSAVFALSQRKGSDGVSALIRIARTNRDPDVRKTALFWLGQSNDTRAIALFEEILTRKY